MSDDLRRIELSGAQLSLLTPSSETSRAASHLRVRVGQLVLRGLSPWARASALPPILRGVVVSASSVAAGMMAALFIFRARRRVGRLASLTIGAAGPLAALGMLRALELRVPDVSPGPWLIGFAAVPVAAIAAAAVAAVLVTTLPTRRRTGST